MYTFLVILFSSLFTITDLKLFGFTTQTCLFFILIPSIFFLKLRLSKQFIIYNLPFLFLLMFGLIILLIKIPNYPYADIYYVTAKNKDLLTELLLSFVLFSLVLQKKLSSKGIRLFIEIYFLLNMIYLLVITFYPEVAIYFHQRVENQYNLIFGRERLLGMEPSYTIPVNILFSLIYMLNPRTQLISILITLFTAFSFYIGQSKTGYIILFIGVCLWVYFKHLNKFNNKKIVSYIFLIIFSVVSFFTISYVDKKFEYTSSYRLNEYKNISFVTRSELIITTLQKIFENPMGLGYGNATIYLSESIENNLVNFESVEIEESSKYARTPKSQLLEYILGGGVIFLFLFLFQIKKLFKIILNIHDNYKKNLYYSIFIILIASISIGERLPYILIMNMLWAIILIDYSRNLNSEKSAP